MDHCSEDGKGNSRIRVFVAIGFQVVQFGFEFELVSMHKDKANLSLSLKSELETQI